MFISYMVDNLEASLTITVTHNLLSTRYHNLVIGINHKTKFFLDLAVPPINVLCWLLLLCLHKN